MTDSQEFPPFPLPQEEKKKRRGRQKKAVEPPKRRVGKEPALAAPYGASKELTMSDALRRMRKIMGILDGASNEECVILLRVLIDAYV